MIVLRFNEEGKARFARLTTENVVKGQGASNKRLVSLIDGKVISAPQVIEQVTNGICLIPGRFSEKEARQIAQGVVGQ